MKHDPRSHASSAPASSATARQLRTPQQKLAEQERARRAAEQKAIEDAAFEAWLEGKGRRAPEKRGKPHAAHAASLHAAGAHADHVHHAHGAHSAQAHQARKRAAIRRGAVRHHDDAGQNDAGQNGAGQNEARPAHRAKVLRKVRRPMLRLKRRQRAIREHIAAARRVPLRRTPFWKHLRRAAALLLLVGGIELTVAVLTTPEFEVQSVEVSGLGVTPAAAVQPLAQELVGQNWLRARTRDVAEKARQIPTVKAARVERVLSRPPLRLALRIEERQPFARVGAGASWFVVDRDGVPFRTATQADEGLYAVTAPALRPDKIRLGRALPARQWQPFVELAAALEEDAERGQKWTLRRTYLDKHGFASLRLQGGANDEMLVRLGAAQWPQKLARARQALAYFEATGRRAVALNLVSFNMPTWTPRVEPDTESDTENAPAAGAADGDAADGDAASGGEPHGDAG